MLDGSERWREMVWSSGDRWWETVPQMSGHNRKRSVADGIDSWVRRMAKEVDEVERLQCLLVVVVRQSPDGQVCNGQWLVLLQKETISVTDVKH